MLKPHNAGNLINECTCKIEQKKEEVTPHHELMTKCVLFSRGTKLEHVYNLYMYSNTL